MDDNSQYLEMFFEETDENLLKLNDLVMVLEQNPRDRDILNDIFRAAHTLKGMAGTMGFETMTEVTHQLENVFSVLKEEKITADEDVIALVYNSLDALSEIVEDIREQRTEPRDYSALIKMSKGILARSDENKIDEPAFEQVQMTLEESDWNVIESALTSDYNVFTISVQIEEDSMMVNARVFLIMNKLEEFGEVLKTEPSADRLETEDFGHLFQCLLVTESDQKTILEMFDEQSEIEKVVVEPITKKEEATKKDDELVVKRAVATHSSNHSVRVDVEKLDSFMNLVSELVIYRTQLDDIGKKTGNKKLTDTLSYVTRITDELQSLVLSIRMQPLHTVTNRFARVVRDLSNDSGKPMELVIEGDDTELDRTIVSELSEPLIHLIRNSADHGIESPEIRSSLWKAPKGIIKISAYQEGNRVFITVSDDGKGLDVDAIKRSAEKKGISTAGLSQKDIQELIFHPGFSTSDTVTKISGRGVGMDVVKTKIQELGGSIDIKSTPNVGTSFRLSLPLTLSIIPGLLVQVEKHTFALPLSVIEKVIHTQREEIKMTHNGEVLLNQGRTVPIIRLEKLLDMADDKIDSSHMVIVTIEGKEFALAVDAIVGQQEVVIKELGSEFGQQTNYLGAAIMGDGSIVMILNVTAICLERNQATYA